MLFMTFIRAYPSFRELTQNSPGSIDRGVFNGNCSKAKRQREMVLKYSFQQALGKIKFCDLLVDVAAIEVDFQLLRRDHGILVCTTAAYGSLWCA